VYLRCVRVATPYRKFLRLRVLLLPVLALAACAGAAPTEELAAARAALVQAQPVAAKEAPAELQAAQAKLARAEDAMRRGDNDAARRLAEQAEVDAKLAWTTAESARSQRAATELERSLQALRDELGRKEP
jgi:hypothetical protein